MNRDKKGIGKEDEASKHKDRGKKEGERDFHTRKERRKKLEIKLFSEGANISKVK